MMFAKKKIVLNSAQGNNKHGVAEITRLDNFTQLSIKLNNFHPTDNSEYVFLLKNNDLQQKVTLTNPCDFSCDVNIPIDLSKKISCLLIESGEKQIPLFWGGTETQTQIMSILNDESRIHKLNLNGHPNDATTHIIPDFETQKIEESAPQNTCYDLQNFTISTPKNTECILCDAPNKSLEIFDQSDIENVVDDKMTEFELVKNFNEPNAPQCRNCKYKNVFYQEKDLNEAKLQLEKIAKLQNIENCQNTQDTAQILQDTSQILQDTTQNDSCNIIDNDNNNTQYEDKRNEEEPYYYGLIKAQYDDMFSKYPTFLPLSNIIENSKWIEVDGIDDPYIMGIIYDEGKAKYLCYGVVQEKKQNPPIEIADSSQWVPFDITNEFGSGVWIMYQSADNGETIKVEVI